MNAPSKHDIGRPNMEKWIMVPVAVRVSEFSMTRVAGSQNKLPVNG